MTSQLIRQERCPVCGGVERQPHQQKRVVTRYVREMLAQLGDADKQRLGTAPIHRCAACGSLYAEAWLRREVAERLYALECGQHFQGWNRFMAAASRDARSNDDPHGRAAEGNLALLGQRIGRLERYAELNCPFAGLLPWLWPQGRLSLGDFGKLAGAVRERQAGFPAAEQPPIPRPDLAGIAETRPEATLLLQHSPMFWGPGCSVDGLSCRAAALGLLDIRLADLEAAAADGERFDVVGLYQVLDHFSDPGAVFARVASVARGIVMQTHAGSRLDLQHPFQLGDGFLRSMEQHGLRMEDISAEWMPFTDVEADDTRTLLFLPA